MRFGVDLTTGINRTVAAWASYSDPSPGPYNSFMDTRGDPEIYLYRGSTPVWRSGAWDGAHLSGIPDMSTYKGFKFDFVNNDQEITYFYSISNQSIVSRLVVNSTGLIQRAIWLWENNEWYYFWSGPGDMCDNIGQCGNYGLCDVNSSPICSCLRGFEPRNPANWNMRDGRDGCVRKTELDCKVNGTDGFVKVSNVKLPESGNCVVDVSLSLDECRDLCLKNCSCAGYASANVSGSGSGSGWFGLGSCLTSDLYVRVAAKDIDTPLTQSHGGGDTTVAIVLSLAAVGGLILTCVGYFLWRRKKRRKVELGSTTFFEEQANHAPGRDDIDLPLFDFGTLAAATNYFSADSKLGEGGYGPVYKGYLGQGQEIAVKRLAKTSVQGVEEFKNEVVLIAKLQHRNLVRLLGCCIQGEESMLVYEYMPNRSLDAFLFEKGGGALLDWKIRNQIIIGIARGLLYLHQDSRFRIIHRDLKASNILLDKDMNPKISDFGMARLFGGDETDFNTRKVVGTYGYMSPEYAMDGIFSMKSDVFSFGVLVLEIISGKKNRGVYAIPPHINLVAHAWSLWKEGRSLQLVDEAMSYSFPTNEVLRCIKLGLLCVQEDAKDRPLMSSVVLMLGSDVASLPQPKQPGFAGTRGPFEVDTSSSNQDSLISNEMSITMLEAR
ncbi:uncharacterized protein A4U43_C07F39200 [Asparagus officinalis]|uniref:non-specific serine/threonine protein kinase n=1 Tax=Asparagus officinalis TaxID=4686 RepID=A0A5P1EI75_ASPOF|nr:uncharacterized protein A4U43_C07F39200 [Asparagus officinalis]